MKLRRSVFTLLVCCSAFWEAVSSRVKAPTSPPPAPPGCDAMLEFSSSSSSSSSSSEGNGNIHSRSLSPWSWRSSTVPHRIPSTLWEAECSSSFCSSPSSGPGDGLHLNSVPIYQNVLVLNRQGSCYRAAYRSVAVGCTCTWSTTTHS